jgi:hypothetical protein
MSKKYVKIWEKYNDEKLQNGYEIHHIDGNHQNNDPENLKAVTVEEHLQIHKDQNDYGAIQAILIRMNRSEEENVLLRESASKHQSELWQNGNHNFQKISKEYKQEICRAAGLKTVENKIGIHAINSDPILAKENGKKARSNLSREKELIMMKKWNEKVKNTKWWVNSEGKRKRSKISPGDEWKEGMYYEN